MCLYVSHKYPHRYIATERMTVFKTLNADRSSVFFRFPYVRNKSYRIPPEKLQTSCSSLIFSKLVVNTGFHAYVWYSDAAVLRLADDAVVCDFFIPVGAHFYIGIDDTIVSDSIVSGCLSDISQGK